MARKKPKATQVSTSPAPSGNRASFAEFIEDPPVAGAFVVIALIALFLAILEFGQTVS